VAPREDERPPTELPEPPEPPVVEGAGRRETSDGGEPDAGGVPDPGRGNYLASSRAAPLEHQLTELGEIPGGQREAGPAVGNTLSSELPLARGDAQRLEQDLVGEAGCAGVRG